MNELADVACRRVPVVHDEVTVRRRHPRAANADALEARAIDEGTRGPWHSLGQHITAWHGILEYAPGARRVERLRPLSKRQGRTCGGPQAGRLARRDSKYRGQEDFLGLLQTAPSVAKAQT